MDDDATGSTHSDRAPDLPADPPTADDPRAALAVAVSTAGALISRVRPNQYGDPTPCDGMDVRALLGHLVMVLERVACAGRAEDPMTWPGEVTEVPDDDWAAAWFAAARSVAREWTDAERLTRATPLPWDTVTGAGALGVYLNEIIVHTWDLATATGLDADWDDGVIELAEVAIHQQLPVADREPIWAAARAQLPEDFPWEDPFGPAVEIPDDAAPIERLVAWNGRRP